MGASGPGTINLTTGLANALIDCAPVVALGGASPSAQLRPGRFQEIDQVAIMRPVTKWAERVYDPRRIPEYVDARLPHGAMSASRVRSTSTCRATSSTAMSTRQGVVRARKAAADAAAPRPRRRASLGVIAMMREAERPILLTGSGILWSEAAAALQRFVDATGIPFYTTPQGRGVIPGGSPVLLRPGALAGFKEADFVLVVGTRLNYVFSYGNAAALLGRRPVRAHRRRSRRRSRRPSASRSASSAMRGRCSSS